MLKKAPRIADFLQPASSAEGTLCTFRHRPFFANSPLLVLPR